MKGLFSRFKIPTILGLGIIILGIAAGVFLTLKEQNIISKASPSVSAQNITLTNISDDSVVISWQTGTPTISFVNLGLKDPSEQTWLDDRDTNPALGPKAHLLHYVTIKNLLPKTTYQYKIVSGKISSPVSKFETAAPLVSQNGFQPVIGSVLDQNQPLDEGITYLSVSGATTQSSLVKTGNFLIPLSQVRKLDLSEGLPLSEDTVMKLTVLSPKGEATTLFKLGSFNKGLPSINLGEALDLTATASPSPSPSNQNLEKYDLNGDGKLNATDNAIILDVINKKTTNKKADLNGDGVVDQKDLDLMSKQINQ